MKGRLGGGGGRSHPSGGPVPLLGFAVEAASLLVGGVEIGLARGVGVLVLGALFSVALLRVNSPAISSACALEALPAAWFAASSVVEDEDLLLLAGGGEGGLRGGDLLCFGRCAIWSCAPASEVVREMRSSSVKLLISTQLAVGHSCPWLCEPVVVVRGGEST